MMSVSHKFEKRCVCFVCCAMHARELTLLYSWSRDKL